MIGWNDPARSYDYYNLIFDVPFQGMPRTKLIQGNTRNQDRDEYRQNSAIIDRTGANHVQEVKPIFSIVKHYPTKWEQLLKEAADK